MHLNVCLNMQISCNNDSDRGNDSICTGNYL